MRCRRASAPTTARARRRSCRRRRRSPAAPGATCATREWRRWSRGASTHLAGGRFLVRRLALGHAHERALVLVPKGLVHGDEVLLLAFGDRGVPQDDRGQIGLARALFEDAGPDVEGLGRDPERLGDLLEYLSGRLAQASFDLAQVRVRDAGGLREVPERQPRPLSLLADEVAEVVHPVLEVLHARELTRTGHVRATTSSGSRAQPFAQ